MTAVPTVESFKSEISKNGFPNNLLPGWKKRLQSEADFEYFANLKKFLQNEQRMNSEVFPAKENILRVFSEVDFDEVRVVILGQDPYHGAGQAIGRSFAVPAKLYPKPPSLKNIIKELSADLNLAVSNFDSELNSWVKQGVFLLNTVLSVRSGQPLSHRDKGWEIFTDKVIALLGARQKPIVFILWGASAQSKKPLIKNPGHLIIESPHPSPLSASRGFFGSKPFSRCNQHLTQKLNEPPIEWA